MRDVLNLNFIGIVHFYVSDYIAGRIGMHL